MAECPLVTFLRENGPQRVPLRPCCVFGLIDRQAAADDGPPVCAAADEVPQLDRQALLQRLSPLYREQEPQPAKAAAP